MEKITSILKGTLDLVFECSKDQHPYEFAAAIRAENGTITEGMIPKIRTCINAAQNGVRGVVIIDGRKPHSILFELFSDQGAGTLIRK